MSLLEDIFLGDEAEEAAELERIVEGDEYDERPQSPQNSDDNSEKEDEAEEEKHRVDPTSGTKAKREIKNPRFVLNPARLTGPRGIRVIPEHFKDFKFKGKGHEKEDLDMVLKKLEHWAYRLYPKFQFEDCLKKIETLGKKRPVAVHLHKIRSDQLVSEETVVQQESDDEPPPAPQEEDEFDKLLQQQIELARATPASVKKPIGSMLTPISDNRSQLNLPSMAPKATSSPSISDEQRERMLLNRRMAEERRLARLNTNSGANQLGADKTQKENETSDITSHEIKDTTNVDMDYEMQDVNAAKASKPKKNRSQVIDTSDSEEEHDKPRENNKDFTFDTLKSQNVEHSKIENIDHAIKSKKNRSQVIDSDSSDSDDFEGTTVNHVTVDVHKTGSQVYTSKHVSETHEKNRQDIVLLNKTEFDEKEKRNDKNSEKQSKAIESVQNYMQISDERTESAKHDLKISEKQEGTVENDTEISELDSETVENDTEMSELQKHSGEINIKKSEKQTETVDNDTEILEIQTETVHSDNYTEISEEQTETVENNTDISEKQSEFVNDSEISEKSKNDLQDTNGNIHVILENVSNNKENIHNNVVKPLEIVAETMDLDFSDDF